jgi:hypothetical protein
MLAIALPPAPPTPMTAIFGFNSSTIGGPMLMLIPVHSLGQSGEKYKSKKPRNLGLVAQNYGQNT